MRHVTLHMLNAMSKDELRDIEGQSRSVLGVGPDATLEEIKRVKNAQSKRNHSDLSANELGRNLSADELKIEDERQKGINNAYDVLEFIHDLEERAYKGNKALGRDEERYEEPNGRGQGSDPQLPRTGVVSRRDKESSARVEALVPYNEQPREGLVPYNGPPIENGSEQDVFGICELCGSKLIRDKQGHIYCSNPDCSTHKRRYRDYIPIFRRNRPTTFGMDLKASSKTRDNVWDRYWDPIRRNFRNTFHDRGHNTRNWRDVREAGEEARATDDRSSERREVEEEARKCFKRGDTYQEAAEYLIGNYSGRGWWDRDEARVLHLQQNEVKAIIWDVYNHPEKHGVSRKEIYDSPGMKDAHKSVKGVSGAVGRAGIHLGNWTNRGNLGKVSNLQTRLAKLESERDDLDKELGEPDVANNEVRFRTVKAQFDAKEREIEETLRKIEDIEKYPELGKRNLKSYGQWFKNRSSSLRDAKENAGGKIVSGYSKLKAKTSGALSLVFAIVIFVAMLVLTQTAGAAYFPVNAWQILVFLVLAILIALIKISLSEDESAEQEAKEIAGLMILIGTIIAIVIGTVSGGFTWASFIFCIICGLYLYFDFLTDNVIVSFLLFVGMCFLIFFTMSGWIDMFSVQVEKLAVEAGFDEAIETSIHSISDGAADVWLMLSDPNGWFQKEQQEKDMEKAEGHSKKALEITVVTMWPGTVNMGETANLAVEVENFGKMDAGNAEIYVKVDKDDLGHVSVRGYDDEEGRALRYIGDVLSGTTARHAFSVVAPPDCVGTFKLVSGVEYDYEVVATGDIAVISKDRFEELRRQGKMKPTRHVTISGDGPVSVNVQTDKDEPIPVRVGGGSSGEDIQVHVTVLNHGSSTGTLWLTGMVVKMPKGFEIHEDVTEDGSKGSTDKFCDLLECEDNRKGCKVDDSDYEYYHVAAFGGDDCGVFIGDHLPDTGKGGGGSSGESESEGGGDEPPGEAEDAGEGEAEDEEVNEDEEEDLEDHCNVLKERRMFTCDMTYTPVGDDELSFPKHLPFMMDIKYLYSYEKKTSFSVRAGFLKEGEKPKKCEDGRTSPPEDGGSGTKRICTVYNDGFPSDSDSTYAVFGLGTEDESHLLGKVKSVSSTDKCVPDEHITVEGLKPEDGKLFVRPLPETECEETITVKFDNGDWCVVSIKVPGKDSASSGGSTPSPTPTPTPSSSPSSGVCGVDKGGDPYIGSSNSAIFKLTGEGPKEQWDAKDVKSTGSCVSADNIKYTDGWSLTVDPLPDKGCSETVTITYENGKTCSVSLNIPAKK